jgi:hypothetical protein
MLCKDGHQGSPQTKQSAFNPGSCVPGAVCQRSEKERQRFAEEKTSNAKLKLDILQSHVDFFRETVKTIDNMIFGVKHRLEIEDFRRGNK